MDQIGDKAAQHIWQEPAAGMGANHYKIGLDRGKSFHRHRPAAADDLDLGQISAKALPGEPNVTLARRLGTQLLCHGAARTIPRQSGKGHWHRME